MQSFRSVKTDAAQPTAARSLQAKASPTTAGATRHCVGRAARERVSALLPVLSTKTLNPKSLNP